MNKRLFVVGTILTAIVLILGACKSTPTPALAPAPETTPASELTPTPEPTTPPAPPAPETVTKIYFIYYDDGKLDGYATQGPGLGYAAYFSPPFTPFKIDKVKLVATLYGTKYAGKKASLEIWDENYDVLYSQELPASEFNPEGGWVTVETDIVVEGNFHIAFFTNSGGQEGGISIGYDSSSENKHSEVVRTGGLVEKWPLSMEETYPEATTNWMIRVTGTYVEQ